MKNLLKKRKTILSQQAEVDHSNLDDAIRLSQTAEKNTDNQTDSFTKIKVSPTPVIKRKPVKKILCGFIFVILLLIVCAVVFAVLPVKATYDEAMKFQSSAAQLAKVLKDQNLAGAKKILPETRKQLEITQKTWDSAYMLRVLPFINRYHADGIHGLRAAGYGLDTLQIAIETIEPYADLLGFEGGSSFVSGSADERIQLAVKTLDKVTPKISEIGEAIEKLKMEVDYIDPNRYPENIRGMTIRPRLIEGKNLLEETTGLFLDAQPLLKVLPQLLGEPKPKRYFVIFQNDKELRSTGGFMTAYAIFKIEGGKFLVETSEDIYELDNKINPKKPAPEEILTYHKGVYYYNIRDSNLSPDFLVSMHNFEELYPGKFDFDGIIAVDTHVLVEAIKILGEFNIAGRTFSAEIDKRCDCPKVIYELEDYSTRPVAYVRETRKDILGALLLEIMKKALGVSPSQYWGQLFQMGLSEISQKHILASMKDPAAQVGIESLNMGGRIADGTKILGYESESWDYLHINDSNMAGAKSNLFVQHFVTQDYTVERDGSITKTVTIEYKNPASPSDCNLESGGLCLNGILRNWIRIYVPKGSALLESKGSQNPKDESPNDLKTVEDLGKTVFEGFLTVRPLGSAELTLKYKLPFKKAGKLDVLYQKQPGTEGHEYTVLVRGRQKEKFNLTTDKTLQLSL